MKRLLLLLMCLAAPARADTLSTTACVLSGTTTSCYLPVALSSLINGEQTTYTPAYSGTANVTGTPTGILNYFHLGTFGVIWGAVSVNPTAGANTQTIFTVSVPPSFRSSNFAANSDATGTFTRFNAVSGAGVISDVGGNKLLDVYFAAPASGSNTYWIAAVVMCN